MTEYQANGYEDDDFRALVSEIETLQDEKASIMGAAMRECATISKKIADRKKEAKDLKIPRAVLGAVLKQRKLERQLQDLADEIPEDLIEVYEDAAGQFSMFGPDDAEEEKAPKAQKAARKSKARSKAQDEAEQEEGEKVLEAVH